MALYEANFIKFAQLAGEPSLILNDMLSVPPKDFPLHLTVGESSKYTRALRLTYYLAHNGSPRADPDLRLRLYLDARMLEVMGWATHHQHGVLLQLRAQYSRELDRRWARNMMLSKWLDYLLEQGHRFGTIVCRREAETVDPL